MSSRTLAIKGDRLKRLRIQQGWSVEELATKAVCSVKTIQSAENSKKMYMSTITKIANALNIKAYVLLAEVNLADPPPPPEWKEIIESKERMFGFFILVNIDFKEVDESVQVPEIVNGVVEAASPQKDVYVVAVRSGSLIVCFAMVKSDVERVVGAFCAYKLDGLAVVALLCPDSLRGQLTERFRGAEKFAQVQFMKPGTDLTAADMTKMIGGSDF